MQFDFKKLMEFTESDEFEKGTRIVNKLLSHWCIPRCKDADANKDWLFIFKHRDVLSDILALSGYTLTVIETRGREMAYISMNEPEETFQKLSKSEATVFLCLRVLYEEHLKKVSEDLNALRIRFSVEDLLSTVCAYKRNTSLRSEMKEIRPILTKMEALNICRVEGVKKDFGPETVISVFPSITALLSASNVEEIIGLLDEYKAETNKKLYLSSDGQFDDLHDLDENFNEE